MPKIKFVLSSQRNRPVTDIVDTYILNGQRVGPIRSERNKKPTNRLFTVDIPPDNYELQLEVQGFKLFRGTFQVRSSDPDSGEKAITLTHQCVDLPEFAELSPVQQGLLATFDTGTPADQIWQGLNDNQAATFFQLSHALSKIQLNNGRSVASYVESVRRIGGVEMEDFVLTDPTSEKTKTSVGWRMHITINRADRSRIVRELTTGDVFGGQDPFTHPTHSNFGLIKSHRQAGDVPKLQLVFGEDNVNSDVDLDIEFDRSAPHDIFRRFIARYPEVAGIYRF